MNSTPERTTSWWRWGAVAAVVALVGIGVMVFLTAGQDPEVATARATTLTARTAELEQRVAAVPDDASAWQALGSSYVRRAAASGDPGFFDLAGRAFDRADEEAPGDPFTLVGRGNLALALHDFELARDLGERAAQQLPRSADPLAILVDAEVELGQYDDAVTHLDALLDLRPDVVALSRVSYLRELHGDPHGAAAAMASARDAAEGAAAFDRATVSALLGDLLVLVDDRAGADAAYTTAADLAPGFVPADVGLARLEAARGETDAAIERLRALVDVQPHPDALWLLADFHRHTGDERAAAQVDEVVRTVATLQEAAGQRVDLEMAWFEADRGDDPQRAIALAQDAYDVRPDNVFTADALAWALHRAGRSDEALPHVEQALRLGSRDPLLNFHAAAIYAAMGEENLARTHLEVVAATDPWFSFALLDEAAALARDLAVDPPAAWVAP